MNAIVNIPLPPLSPFPDRLKLLAARVKALDPAKPDFAITRQEIFASLLCAAGTARAENWTASMGEGEPWPAIRTAKPAIHACAGEGCPEAHFQAVRAPMAPKATPLRRTPITTGEISGRQS